MRGTAKKACYHKANQARPNSTQPLASRHPAMRCYVVALCSALLTLTAVSPIVAGPCPVPTCQQHRPPDCPSPGSSCGCRCNNSGAQGQPGGPGGGYPSSQPRPCGGSAGYISGQGTTIGGAVTQTTDCKIQGCRSGERPLCLRYEKYGTGCDCKCVPASTGCGNNSPWGLYVCIHVCSQVDNTCLCRCVADRPFSPPPPCRQING
ncbi:uncharacterized protein [Dermacentor andersoni]|uniref:uncharacterized protein n=1 Tax=Dermacentor andersoni TaxID=34620 RepID=UPI00241683FF|nr:uncharacterized protein LOC126533830 [Dermacentor andersoni]